MLLPFCQHTQLCCPLLSLANPTPVLHVLKQNYLGIKSICLSVRTILSTHLHAFFLGGGHQDQEKQSDDFIFA